MPNYSNSAKNNNIFVLTASWWCYIITSQTAEEFSQAFYEIVKDFADEKGTEVEDILKGSAMFGANASIHANILRQSKGRLKLPKKPEFYEKLFVHMFFLNKDEELLREISADCNDAIDSLVDERF